MTAPEVRPPSDDESESIRLQAEEHPLIEDVPPATPAEHGLRLMHLRAYDEAVRHAAGRDVLDVGCNTGYGTIRFVPVASRVVGVDVSPRAIEAARVRAPDGHPEFVLSGGFDLPFPDGAFDLVTSFQVLEHVPDPTVFLRELVRVTKPGGQVILATPNAATRLDPGMTPWNRFHVREYAADELRDLLSRVFPVVRIRGMFGTPTLYETEIRRVDAARQRIRRLAAAERARIEGHTRPPKPISSRPRQAPAPLRRRVASAVVPGSVKQWFRAALVPAPVAPLERPAPAAPDTVEEPAAMGLETFLEFTVDDLFYADRDLDRAMDLLAVCRVEPVLAASGSDGDRP